MTEIEQLRDELQCTRDELRRTRNEIQYQARRAARFERLYGVLYGFVASGSLAPVRPLSASDLAEWKQAVQG